MQGIDTVIDFSIDDSKRRSRSRSKTFHKDEFAMVEKRDRLMNFVAIQSKCKKGGSSHD